MHSALIFKVQDKRDGRKILELLFEPHDVFLMQYIHAVKRTPYTNIFKVDSESNIILSGTVYESEGGGFPVAGDGIFSVSDGTFRMDEMNRFIGILRLRVSPVSQETLLVSNAEVPLYKLVPEGTLIEIKVSKAWLWSFRGGL